MSGMLIFALAACVALLVYALLTRGSSSDTAARHARAFDEAISSETSSAARALHRIARPLSAAPLANPAEESPLYRSIRLKLSASNGLFGGSVEVFLANQMACLIVAAAGLSATVLAAPGGMGTLIGLIGSVAVTAWPYSRIHEAAKKHEKEVSQALPVFAEMLLMPLSSGYGILAALDFAAGKTEGPVSREVHILVESINTRSRDEAQAFADAADNLGTPAARSFFQALAQAYLDGVRVADTIRSQAESLRKAEYERVREEIKKVPVSIAIVLGVHLMPGLFIMTLFPVFYTLGQM